MRPIPFKASPVQVDFRQFAGGLDLVTPAIELDAGRCIDAQNYEPDVVAGYRRINGFERYDGRASPTNASYWTMGTAFTSVPSIGATVTGATSGAHGRVLALLANNTLAVLGRVGGNFAAGESLTVGGVTVGQVVTGSAQAGAASPADDADNRLLAANDWRSDIGAVPGFGPVRGVFLQGDVLYALRDNVGATQSLLYKSTASGWVQVQLGTEIQFTAATATQLHDGDTITGGTSGATATVARVLLRTGTWGSAGAGTLVLTSITGTFQSGEALKRAGTTACTAATAATAITRAPGGTVHTVSENFFGAANTVRTYGADGVNPAFEFDGTVYVPIRTGMTQDAPTHVWSFRNYLFLAFGASVQFSAVAAPYTWTAVLGAGEISTGYPVTGFRTAAGTSSNASLAIFTQHRTFVLYGTSSQNFQLIPSIYDLGYQAGTMQLVANNIYGLTGRGVQSLITTLDYGDFSMAAVSYFVQPLLARKMGLACASVSLRAKNQYRLYFSDGTGLVFGLAGEKLTAILPLNYGKPVRCITNATLTTGEEVTFFGSDDGYVYQDSVGTSFDGAPIEAWVRTAFNNLKSPRVRKQYRRAIFEVKSEGFTQVNCTYDLGYGSSNVEPAAVQQDQQIPGGGGYWDQVTWDQFTWDTPLVNTAQLAIDGTETNISFLFYSNRAQDDAHVLQGVSLLSTVRRLVHTGA